MTRAIQVLALVTLFVARVWACPPGTSLQFVSSLVSGHSHTLSLPCDDVNQQPSVGVTYITSLVGGHTHSITLSASTMMAIRLGSEVLVQTSTNAGHSHIFLIQDPNPIAVTATTWDAVKQLYGDVAQP